MVNRSINALKKVNYRIAPCCGNCSCYHQTTEIDYWDSDFDTEPPENPDSVVSRMCYDEEVGELDDKYKDDSEYFSPHPCFVCDRWKSKFNKYLFFEIDEIMTPKGSGAISENAMKNLIRLIKEVPDIHLVPMNIYNNGVAGGIDFRIGYINKYINENYGTILFDTFFCNEMYQTSGIIGDLDAKKMVDFLNRTGNYDNLISVLCLVDKDVEPWLERFHCRMSLRYNMKMMAEDYVDFLAKKISSTDNVAPIREICNEFLQSEKESQEGTESRKETVA